MARTTVTPHERFRRDMPKAIDAIEAAFGKAIACTDPKRYDWDADERAQVKAAAQEHFLALCERLDRKEEEPEPKGFTWSNPQAPNEPSTE